MRAGGRWKESFRMFIKENRILCSLVEFIDRKDDFKDLESRTCVDECMNEFDS